MKTFSIGYIMKCVMIVKSKFSSMNCVINFYRVARTASGAASGTRAESVVLVVGHVSAVYPLPYPARSLI